MKSLVSCLTLALLLAVPSSGAQTRELAAQEVTVEVPFDFMVRQVMFPAGNYTIKPLQNRTFYLKATLGRESVSVATEPIPSADPHSAGLIFDEHDGHYHLRELWMDSMIGVEVPEPRGEQLRLVRFSGTPAEVLPASCTTCQ
jgi:hypothetical protein